MKSSYTVIIATVMSALILGLVGCAQKEGPAEQAGKSVDKAMDKAGQKIEQAGKRRTGRGKGRQEVSAGHAREVLKDAAKIRP